MKQSLRDIARSLSESHRSGRQKQLEDWWASDEYKRLAIYLERQSNIAWYINQGYKLDVGFERLSERSRYVRCVICHHSGAGVTGSFTDAERGGLARQWQYDHCKPHTFECACGMFFTKSQAIGAHVAANRRHRKPGHGRMDKVGY